MTREILFRAKRIDNGEWEYGSLIILPDGKAEIANKCVHPPDSDPMWKRCVITHEVDPSTICQYTGLTDKNGTKIFENDIVSIGRELCTVRWQKDTARFVLNDDVARVHCDLGNYWGYDLEVIGNIFDNHTSEDKQNDTNG